MDLRQIYGDIAKQIAGKRDSTQPYLFVEDFDSVATYLFSKTVQIEKALIADDERRIRREIACFTATVLDVLEHWDGNWCLRNPKFTRGKFLNPSELTKDLRFCLLEMFENFKRQAHISRDVGIGLELLLKRSIELSYKLDFDLAMALFEYLREEK